MTVDESCNVNTLLRYLLGCPRPTGDPVTSDDAATAAAWLADKAHSTLMAGLDGDDVRSLWGRPGTPLGRPVVTPDR